MAPAPNHPPSDPLPTRYFVPVGFAHPCPLAGTLTQEPKSTSDTPSGGPSGAPAGGTDPGAGQTAAPGGQQAPPQSPCASDQMLWMMPVFLGLMYFMLIRPDQKRRKEQANLLASMQKGDSVVTVSGMHGVISKLADKTVTLRVDSIEITFDRTSVARIVRGDAAAPTKT